jgi:hypothetical protein
LDFQLIKPIIQPFQTFYIELGIPFFIIQDGIYRDPLTSLSLLYNASTECTLTTLTPMVAKSGRKNLRRFMIRHIRSGRKIKAEKTDLFSISK